MKKSILNSAVAAIFLSGVFFACSKPAGESAQEKADQAKEQAQEAKQDVNASNMDEERATYKAEKLQKIADNEKRIAELREKQKTSGKTMDKILQSRIEALEKRNAELKDKLNNYQDTDNAKWEEFKREFNHDMDELGNSINDIGKDNVK